MKIYVLFIESLTMITNIAKGWFPLRIKQQLQLFRKLRIATYKLNLFNLIRRRTDVHTVLSL